MNHDILDGIVDGRHFVISIMLASFTIILKEMEVTTDEMFNLWRGHIQRRFSLF